MGDATPRARFDRAPTRSPNRRPGLYAPPMPALDLERAAQVASHACDLARREIMPRFCDVSVEFKADGSPVTEADRAAERAIRGVLESAYPDFGLLGEEYGENEAGREGPRWIVDPIDGTIAFSRGIPLFGTLIALLVDDEPVLGIIDLPALDERYVGWTGAGCHRNGRRVRVSDRTDPTQCLASTGDRVCFEWSGRQAGLERMTAELPLLRTYTDAFGHSLVLSGAVDVMVDCDLNPWDAAATQILAVEAGGACVSLTSARDKLDLIFGNPALVERVADFFEADQ